MFHTNTFSDCLENSGQTCELTCEHTLQPATETPCYFLVTFSKKSIIIMVCMRVCDREGKR